MIPHPAHFAWPEVPASHSLGDRAVEREVDAQRGVRRQPAIAIDSAEHLVRFGARGPLSLRERGAVPLVIRDAPRARLHQIQARCFLPAAATGRCRAAAAPRGQSGRARWRRAPPSPRPDRPIGRSADPPASPRQRRDAALADAGRAVNDVPNCHRLTMESSSPRASRPRMSASCCWAHARQAASKPPAAPRNGCGVAAGSACCDRSGVSSGSGGFVRPCRLRRRRGHRTRRRGVTAAARHGRDHREHEDAPAASADDDEPPRSNATRSMLSRMLKLLTLNDPGDDGECQEPDVLHLPSAISHRQSGVSAAPLRTAASARTGSLVGRTPTGCGRSSPRR